MPLESLVLVRLMLGLSAVFVMLMIASGTGWPTALMTLRERAPPLARFSRLLGTIFVTKLVIFPVDAF